ncbi:hypothetical protein [Rickettsia endosymbiont of Oedothorax gibbosus]|uniref:hypothetical protein n=1 Tax=Rickettsia endosymbiont of Oedothorax gibbosus TaxID=931099 RepID=UPI002025988E|nr:hypothetical protein [Rickettsia endosymbiont of Oedothorax gibbosus]
MSKNQDNASLISDETTEAQRKKHEEFLADLEDVRAKFEEKSVEEIKKSSILELAKYFCNDYLLIIKHQKQSEKFSDPQSSEEEQLKAHSYLDKHTESNTIVPYNFCKDGIRIEKSFCLGGINNVDISCVMAVVD